MQNNAQPKSALYGSCFACMADITTAESPAEHKQLQNSSCCKSLLVTQYNSWLQLLQAMHATLLTTSAGLCMLYSGMFFMLCCY
jgi:hypothetical protein